MHNLSHLEQRALSAYFRKESRELNNLGGMGSVMQPGMVETLDNNDLTYIRLSNVRGILAVYRVRTVNGKQVLKGLKRWPAALDI